MFSQLNHDCCALIGDFAGFADQWKHRFTTDVLPKIEQGWADVAIDDWNGGMPCPNCYMYGNTGDYGQDGICINCQGDEEIRMTTVSFDQIKSVGSFRHFHTFEIYKRYRDFYLLTNFSLNPNMLQASPVFKQIQMYYWL